jgi:hypothetical protein
MLAGCGVTVRPPRTYYRNRLPDSFRVVAIISPPRRPHISFPIRPRLVHELFSAEEALPPGGLLLLRIAGRGRGLPPLPSEWLTEA